ncbi:hypothetical protein CFIO01_10047 [Colletotrichum fioriniae PJ7]|uniref:Uncharacterized protein n=1 Tax=Colletotrichum fioriniae PJ7 TaxID=1445577 RepID=A0A010RWW9_9PEZI|nr:hypothetical protein CFIO01_10047 [Colletotrichum fioriniae PJ7]
MSTLILAVELETPKVAVPSACSTLDWHHWNLAWKLSGKVCRIRPFPCGAWAIGTSYQAKLFLDLGSTYGPTADGTEEVHLGCTLPKYFVANAPQTRTMEWAMKGGSRLPFLKNRDYNGQHLTSPHLTLPPYLLTDCVRREASEHLGNTADAAAVTSRQSYQS